MLDSSKYYAANPTIPSILYWNPHSSPLNLSVERQLSSIIHSENPDCAAGFTPSTLDCILVI
jgi:hypothetical protein